MVLGTVNNVYFQDLMADFSISAVQDDDVHLPEIHEVPLDDLWPTIDQENTELNVERTADCIDELRLVSYGESSIEKLRKNEQIHFEMRHKYKNIFLQ